MSSHVMTSLRIRCVIYGGKNPIEGFLSIFGKDICVTVDGNLSVRLA